jgi:hypothetical protein
MLNVNERLVEKNGRFDILLAVTMKITASSLVVEYSSLFKTEE